MDVFYPNYRAGPLIIVTKALAQACQSSKPSGLGTGYDEKLSDCPKALAVSSQRSSVENTMFLPPYSTKRLPLNSSHVEWSGR